jgi:hypothetical protein
VATVSKSPLLGGELERTVMETEVMVSEVHDQIGIPNQLAYTTIVKVLDRFVAKELAMLASGIVASAAVGFTTGDDLLVWLPGVLR